MSNVREVSIKIPLLVIIEAKMAILIESIWCILEVSKMSGTSPNMATLLRSRKIHTIPVVTPLPEKPGR